jgi:anti-sigma B factor antagonist
MCAAAVPWTPPVELVVHQAESIRQALLERLANPAPLGALDFSQVTMLDSAGIQLLLALRRSLVARGESWRVASASDAVNDVLRVYGMMELVAGSSGEQSK